MTRPRAAHRQPVPVAEKKPDLGEVREELDAEYGGDPIAIGFNPKYVVELLMQMSSDQIAMVSAAHRAGPAIGVLKNQHVDLLKN